MKKALSFQVAFFGQKQKTFVTFMTFVVNAVFPTALLRFAVQLV